MELIKKNIHMDRIKCKAATQITLEDDRNVPDQKPDMERLILQKGEIKTEEIKAAEDHVNVKGKLVFSILYVTDEGNVSRVDGQLPYEEQVYMEGVRSGDTVEVRPELENMSIDMINSRKLSVRALLSLSLCVEELYDEEMAVELYHEEPIETKKKLLTIAEIAIQKKDILRFKEEIEMPQSFPNIFEIIWEDVRISGMGFEALNGQIAAQGEIQAFFLYEGEGEERPLKCYEKTIPFRETIECQGCSEAMIPDISYHVSPSETEARADFDGEERVACLDLVLDLDIKMYEEEQIEALRDVYGVSKDVQAVTKQGSFSRMLVRTSGRTKLTEQVSLPAGVPELGEICHSSGEIMMDSMELTENGMELAGTLAVEILYTAGDEKGLFSFQTELPFQYEMEAQDLGEACSYDVKPSVEQLTVAVLGSGELDVKAVLGFGLLGFCSMEENTITDISITEPDLNVLKDLPGIVAYIAKEGDDLWNLGKRYYVPLEQIREMNHLSGDILKAGEKILIVR